MSPSRQALSTCGTKLRLVHNPAARPNAVSHHVCMSGFPSRMNVINWQDDRGFQDR